MKARRTKTPGGAYVSQTALIICSPCNSRPPLEPNEPRTCSAEREREKGVGRETENEEGRRRGRGGDHDQKEAFYVNTDPLITANRKSLNKKMF